MIQEAESHNNDKDIITVQEAYKALFQGGLNNKIISGDNVLLILFDLEVEITNCNFECDVFIEEFSIKGLIANETKFRNLSISNTHIKNLKFNECTIQNLFISSVSNKGQIRFTNCNIEEVSLYKNEFSEGVEFVKSLTKYNQNPTSKISHLSISYGTQIIRLIEIDIYQLTISDQIDERSVIYLENGGLNIIFFNYLNNKGVIKLNGMMPDKNRHSEINILNSDLGEFHFQNIDLNRFNVFNVTTSNLMGVTSFNTVWPNKIRCDDILHKIEIYRQFKQVAIREGNKPNELKYLAKEKISSLFYEPLIFNSGLMDKIRSFCKIERLLNKNKVFNRIFKFFLFIRNSITEFLENLAEKSILIIGLITNNFGNYWVLPILWLFVMNSIAFYLICENSCLSYESDFNKFWLILNPTHSTKFLEDLTYANELAFSVDYLSRVVNAFLYVQIVTGFRKHSKK